MQLGKTLLKQVDTGWEQEVEVRYIIPPKFRWILRAWGDTSCQPAAYAVEHCLLQAYFAAVQVTISCQLATYTAHSHSSAYGNQYNLDKDTRTAIKAEPCKAS